MEFKSYFTGSSGNLYEVRSKSRLLIEAGISIKQIKKTLDFQLHNFSGCLITHEHKDHSKSVLEIMKLGIKVYCTQGAAQALGITENHNWIKIEYNKTFQINEFVILPFETQHDAEEPCGFLIKDIVANEQLIFATDTYYIKYKFKNIDYYCIECNYIYEILKENVMKGEIVLKHKKRVMKSHFSLKNLIKYLEKTDLKKCKKIYLLHLSNNNSNVNIMKNEIEKRFFIETIICKEANNV